MRPRETGDGAVPSSSLPGRPVRASAPLFWMVTPPLALAGLALLASGIGFPLFHTLAELLSIAIALTAFLLAATSRLFTKHQLAVWIAIASGWCAVLDFAHLVMLRDLAQPFQDDNNAGALLWLLSRVMLAAALLTAPLLPGREIRVGLMHTIFGTVALGGVALVVTGHGPSAVGRHGDELIIIMLAAALALFWHRRRLLAPSLLASLVAALVALLLSEVALSHIDDHVAASLIGHVLKISVSWFIYTALVQNTLREPFSDLASAAISYDAVPDPTLVCRTDGIICRANHAAALRAGVAAERLVGLSVHDVFHDAAGRREDCPVCVRMARGGMEAATVIEIHTDRTVLECSLSPVPGEALCIEVIRDVTEHRRLEYLYEMLSAMNRAIVHCRTSDELLAALYDTLVAHSTFPMLFIACADDASPALQVQRVHGIAPAGRQLLEKALADGGSALARTLPELLKDGVLCAPLHDDPAPDAWQAWQYAAGMRARALLPLLCEGRLCGIVGLYADSAGAFDTAELRLLNEMAGDMGLALNALLAEERRLAAERRAGFSEHRFREVFESSPLPMQIIALETGENRAINLAHQQWLGYALEEIRSEESWLDRIFEQPEVRARVRDLWRQHCAIAKSSAAPLRMNSPELVLRCRNGSQRIARGSMTVVGDDAVLAWTDMTDVRNSENALRESEQRFRSMIERALSGIYVRRGGKFLYVNPRFCEIMGWPAEELIGSNMLDFAEPDKDNLTTILGSWARADAGEHGVAYTVRIRRKDGNVVEIGVNTAPINWDGAPAVIAMAADITERKRTQAQIEDYVKRLEASMKGTLQAVSTMVEMRDPYTAGHERRVGLIAAAIGRRLGWDDERCAALEMVGLVHDIGKIAVPVEILAKPTRLSPTELALVRGHAQAGYDILRDVPLPYSIPVAEIIYQHHERIDGSGYPRGLRDGEILPEARVLAVADVLESMASHRPYRPALGIEVALAELEKGRDSHYDPVVVDATLAMVREENYRLPE